MSQDAEDIDQQIADLEKDEEDTIDKKIEKKDNAGDIDTGDYWD